MGSSLASMRASGAVGAMVFAGTLIYCIDRMGWPAGILIGWLPALVMGVVASVAHLGLSMAVAVTSP